jgi:GNAT superfamily N-acetyltransferase
VTGSRYTASDVVRLGDEHTDAIVTVLREAFYDYPVMRFVLGAEGDYDARILTLNHLFVMGRVLRGEPRYGILNGAELVAAATVSYPDGSPAPDGYGEVADRTWAELGLDARDRYKAYAAEWNGFLPSVPHTHLNMIGTTNATRGMGLGRLLMDRVHRLSVESPDSEGVSLSTEHPRNVPIYEHVGYRIIAHKRVAPELESWGMYRPDAT